MFEEIKTKPDLENKIDSNLDHRQSPVFLFYFKVPPRGSICYYRDDKWRCTDKKCLATISVDVSTDIITDVSKTNHVGHNEKSPCEIEVRRAIEQMKIDVRKETTLDHKEIYSRNKEAVIKKGHHLSDIHNFIAPYIKFL
jgi:hypothetical protein